MFHRMRTTAALLLAFCSAACGEAPRDAGELDVGELEPGPVVQGLFLAARLDARRGLIRYEVENAGEHPFRYAQGHLGHVLEVRRQGASASLHLKPRPDAMRFVSGMGPIPRDVRVLEPAGRLPREAFRPYVDQRRFGPNGDPRRGLEVPQATETFTLDLLDYAWPDSLGDLDAGVLEVRVVLILPDWSELLSEPVPSGRIPSAALLLDLADVPTVVRAELDRGGE